MGSNQHYFRSADEMFAAFPGHKSAVSRTMEIADRIEPDVFSNFYARKRRTQQHEAIVGRYAGVTEGGTIKDVAKVLGIPLENIESITKLLPTEVHDLIDFVAKIKSLNRCVLPDFSAVAVADEPLIEYVPLQLVGDNIVTQWNRHDLQEMGVLVLDTPEKQ
jgi:DNA polymerase-3 subunit alpha